MRNTRRWMRGGSEPEPKEGVGDRGCPPACFLHCPTPEEREGDPRGAAAGQDSAARAPAPGFPTSGCSSPGGAVPAANLPGSPATRGSAVIAMLHPIQAGPPSSVFPEPARLSSQSLLSLAGDSFRSPLPAPAEPQAALWLARSFALSPYQVGTQLFAPRSRARPARLRRRSHSVKMRPSEQCARGPRRARLPDKRAGRR